jgi:(p)ppGpp synthase/HD superfamily hydrolase
MRRALFDTIEHERRQRLLGRERPDPNAFALWHEALALDGGEGYSAQLQAAYRYARSLPYAHEGLEGDIYVAHPIRVAALALLSQERPDAQLGVLALIHNVLEVSNVSSDRLVERFGGAIAEQIVNLTVDRAQQWDETYKRAYYDRLNAGPAHARVVKVFDKFDNLFLLGLNPDATIRQRYLREVETHVLPMAERELPSIHPYMTDLVRDCRDTGYFGSD